MLIVPEQVLDVSFESKFGPFVFAEHTLAIPKPALMRAYAIAIKEFYTVCNEKKCSDHTMALSGVINLAVTEHLTAINVRKRYLAEHLQGYLKTSKSVYKNLKELIESELRWMEILLESRLNKHTKSPMLWAHRKWVLTDLTRKIDTDLDLVHEIDFIREEKVVLRAAHLHPMNYYAWSHLRWVQSTSKSVDWEHHIQRIYDFCKFHVSDISGWSYLLWAVEKSASPSICMEYATKVWELSRIATDHEALWFAMKVLAWRSGDGAIDRIRSVDKEDTDYKWASKSLSWIEQMGDYAII